MNQSQPTSRSLLRPISSTDSGRKQSSLVTTSPRPQSTISSLPARAEKRSTDHISEKGLTGQTTDKGLTGQTTDKGLTGQTTDKGSIGQTTDKTSTGRFNAKKKQKRGKRGRSDGFVLGLDLANEGDSDTENKEQEYFKKPGLDSESLNFIFWLRNPSVQNLSQLKKAIKCNDQDWMRCFLEFDGLGLLFQCLKNLSSYQSTHLNDMVLRMVCVSCIREVVNSRSGLDCLLSIGNRNDNLFGRRFSIETLTIF
ncbi:Inverted formin-2 [Bulinus truncatus]|nr:Inverted formin-2 [Bulinus truncatus]